MKLKQHLIHLLGGMTVEESQDSDTNSFMMGQWTALHEAKTFAESLNGLPADDWCKTVYNHFADRIEEVEHISAACAIDPELTEAPVSEGWPRGEKPRNWPLPPMETAPKVPAKRWMPEVEETYYYIEFVKGDIFSVEESPNKGSYVDFATYESNNCFKTEALAQAALDEIRDVLKFAKKE